MDSEFNLDEGRRLKDEGMQRAALSSHELLMYARKAAIEIAKEGDGLCNIDQVRRVMNEEGLPSGMWAGSVFKDGNWEVTGEWTPSTCKSNHARPVMVWRLIVGDN
jgi:hypothetical protein